VIKEGDLWDMVPRLRTNNEKNAMLQYRVGQSAIARLVTPKPYQYKWVCDRLDQQESDRKREDTSLMRKDTTQDTSPPPSEDKVKNKHVQEVEEWIATTVKGTLFDCIKSKALEKIVEKGINEEMARSNWEMNLEEQYEGMVREDAAQPWRKKSVPWYALGRWRRWWGKIMWIWLTFMK
jgi:hypothetical protein